MSGIIDKLKGVIGKALVDSVDDDNPIQLLKITGVENEVIDGVERVQNYGLTSNPPNGSEVMTVFVGGSRDHGVAVSVDCGKFRVVGLKSGEVCVYSQFGQTILLDENGETVFNGGTDYAVAFNELKTAFNELKTAFNNHTHGVTGTANLSTGTVTGTAAVSATQSAANIDAAKVAKVRLP